MPTMTITITEEAYKRLKAKKERNESFTDVILKITSKRNISDFAGMLTEKEASDLESNIRDARSRSRARMDHIRKRMSE
ncbi:MAG: antitoxin VapB family protein [Candidatus Aenigmarchaeota archaeon]|nr:antitoxin VapB family protein [Candidatus Aenigmarchaeota archaeon]